MRTVIRGPCPSCSNEIEHIYQTEDIPYFSELLIISAQCPTCGYRYVDTQILKSAEPCCHEFSITTSEDLNVRVVRSMSGTIKIPEFGVQIDPGPACEGFVTNIEGVLDRIENVVKAALLWTEKEENKNAQVLLERIDQARKGNVLFSLIIEDPSGNSAIISEKAQKKPLDISMEDC
ncbi:MAG: ZPR1 zinc finger domain-containing protein [Methanoregulaceae archaeon]